MFDAIARFYDADYRAYDADIHAIVEFACDAGGPTLELGCGTGRLLLPLAEQGCRATGVDNSPALLARARSKIAAGDFMSRLTLVEDDLRTFDLSPAAFGFAFCTSNTLMHLTSPADQQRVLEKAFSHLMPGGTLLIDLFNPDPVRLAQVNGLQELADRWFDDSTGAEVIKWSVRTVDWAEQLQETLFIYEELLPDGTARRTACPFELRFLWRHEAELMLAKAGFRLLDLWGDFDGAPYDAYAERLILLAEKPA